MIRFNFLRLMNWILKIVDKVLKGFSLIKNKFNKCIIICFDA